MRLWERRRSLSTSSYLSPSEHTLPCSTRSPTLTLYLACSARSTLLANPVYPPGSPGSLGSRRGRMKGLEMISVPRGAVLNGYGTSRQRTIGKQDFPPCCSFPLPVAPIFHRPCHDHALGNNNHSRALCCTGWKSPFQLLFHSFTLQATAHLCTYTREREDVSLFSELRGLQKERTQVTQPLSGPSQHPEESRLPTRNQTALRLVDLERTQEVIIMEKE